MGRYVIRAKVTVMPVLRHRRVRPGHQLVAIAIAAALLITGCMGSGPTTSPMPSAGAVSPAASLDAATACAARAAGAEPTQYAGWPPAETFELVPIPVSTELAVGPNRFLLNLLDSRNEPLASPDREVNLRFFNLARDATQPQVSASSSYLPTVESLPGLYRAEVDFTCWGEWGVEAVATEADGSERVGRMIFPVRPTSSTPALGAPAPASVTPTASTAAEIAAISTDTDPDPDFYAASIDEALAAGEPFLVVFSTPAFCRTATCGPTLDIVKSVAANYDSQVTFIHVEPYELATVDGQLQPVLSDQNLPLPVAAVTQWGLPTEPYIFVVDAAGRVTAKLEGVASADEIEVALDEVTAEGS